MIGFEWPKNKAAKMVFIILAGVFFLHSMQAAPAESSDFSGYGIGLQGTFPAWGLSGTYDMDDNISLQAILGFGGAANAYAVRGLYRFKHEQSWNAYGYGSVGLWTYRHWHRGSESALGFGAGAGIEYDWRYLNPDLPPLFWNIELGIGIVGLDHYSVSALWIGTGVIYRF